MRELEIRAVDAGDAGGIDAWYAAYRASDTHQRPAASPWRRREIGARLRPSTSRWWGAWSGLVDGDFVAAGFVELSLKDNQHLAQVEVHVLPGSRRRGFGTAMLARLEEEARSRGRRTAYGDIGVPLDGPEDGRGWPGVEFAVARGYTFALGEVQRRAALPLPEELLEKLAAQAAPHHADYRIVSFPGPAPEEYVAGLAALSATLMEEMPTGEMELHREDTSVEGWREREADIAADGLTLWHTVALAPDGATVAYSTLAVSAEDHALCHQWGTLVAPAHRGHRLGLAVKVANHRAMQQAGVEVAEIATWNAGVNAPMIGVNELLGFRPVEGSAEYQREL